MSPETTTDFDDYIASFPREVQSKLKTLREIILNEAPEAIEGMAYGMPSFKTNKKALVYFAGYKGHIGFYATPTGHEAFADRFSRYKQGKGSVQFPLDEELPLELIRDILRFRVRENEEKHK